MQTQLIAVGNSKGLRLPKALLLQCGIEDKVNLTVTPQGLLLSPVRTVREGWETAMLASPNVVDEQDEVARTFTRTATFSNAFDATEWTWPEQDQ